MTAVSRRGLLLGGASLAAAEGLGTTSQLITPTAFANPGSKGPKSLQAPESTAGPPTPGPAWWR